MSRPCFLADHCLNERIVKGVLRREPAIEFRLARDLGLEEGDDDAILAVAAEQRWIVVSHDVNTMSGFAQTRVKAGAPMTGLFLARQDVPIAPLIESIVLTWSCSEAEEWSGQIKYLPF